MKVAIIGGGISGLCCAHELERYHIRPVLYERNSFIGEPWNHVSAIMGITHRPIKDALRYFSEKMNIDIKPLNKMTNVIHTSPYKITPIRGNLGYFFLNGREDIAVKRQIFSTLKKTEFRLDEAGDYQKLARHYDYVVIASGSYVFAKELGCWQKWLDTYVRGAVVLGNFDPNTLTVWLNKDYCKSGYAYLTPFNEKKASLVLISTEVSEREMDLYWDLFLYAENLRYTITEEFKFAHQSGYTYPKTLDNIIFIGNSAGGVEPFLGFGLMNAVTMGVSAARTIATGKDYYAQIKSIVTRNQQMRKFRLMLDQQTNRSYDNLFATLKTPGVKQLLYDTNINVSKYGAFASQFILQKTKK